MRLFNRQGGSPAWGRPSAGALRAMAALDEPGLGASPATRARLAISRPTGHPRPEDAGSLAELDRRPDEVAWLIVRAISVRAA